MCWRRYDESKWVDEKVSHFERTWVDESWAANWMEKPYRSKDLKTYLNDTVELDFRLGEDDKADDKRSWGKKQRYWIKVD